MTGRATEELVRDQVRQLRDVHARQKRLENLLVDAYRALPKANHLDTIPGIGDVTAAVLTAFILDIDRFDTPGKLVAYFGVLPIEMSSGVDRDGQPRGSRRYVMSRRGNDLVRRYLWMAALSAVRCNPAVRALYRRVVAKHPEHKAIAIGHAMRKLLHLVFAIWKSDRPFDPKHYPWEGPATPAVEGSRRPGAPAARRRQRSRLRATSRRRSRRSSGHRSLCRHGSRRRARLTRGPSSTSPTSRGSCRWRGCWSTWGCRRVCAAAGRSGAAPARCIAATAAAAPSASTWRPTSSTASTRRCGQEGDVIDLWAALHQLTPARGGPGPGADLRPGTRSRPRNREEERLTTVAIRAEIGPGPGSRSPVRRGTVKNRPTPRHHVDGA